MSFRFAGYAFYDYRPELLSIMTGSDDLRLHFEALHKAIEELLADDSDAIEAVPQQHKTTEPRLSHAVDIRANASDRPSAQEFHS